MNAITTQDQFLPGLSLPATQTFDDWSSLGTRLCMSARAVNWLIGDWLIDGAERFGEKAREEAQRIFHSDVARFDPIVKTCRRFPADQRRPALTFGHHLAVASIDDDTAANQVLDDAERTEMTVAALKATVRIMTAGNRLPGMEDDDPIDAAYRAIVQAWNRASKAARELFAESVSESHMGVIEL